LHQLDFPEKVGAAADYDSINAKALTDRHQGFKAVEKMKGNLVMTVKPLQMEIEINSNLFDGKMKDRLSRSVNGLWTGPVLEDGTFCVLQLCSSGQWSYKSVW